MMSVLVQSIRSGVQMKNHFRFTKYLVSSILICFIFSSLFINTGFASNGGDDGDEALVGGEEMVS